MQDVVDIIGDKMDDMGKQPVNEMLHHSGNRAERRAAVRYQTRMNKAARKKAKK